MPIELVYTTRKGKKVKGYRWGKHGKIYYGEGGRARAARQGRAVEMSKHNPTQMRRNK